jgi:hypothetical protein
MDWNWTELTAFIQEGMSKPTVVTAGMNKAEQTQCAVQ